MGSFSVIHAGRYLVISHSGSVIFNVYIPVATDPDGSVYFYVLVIPLSSSGK